MRGIKEVKKELTLIMAKNEREKLSDLLTQIYGVFLDDFGLTGEEFTFSELADLMEEGVLNTPNFSMFIVEVKN